MGTPCSSLWHSARDIRRFPGDPQLLRSNSEPKGLSELHEEDARRVCIANELFAYSCRIFEMACSRGIWATMEDPRNSYFWLTKWVLALMVARDLFAEIFKFACLAEPATSGQGLLDFFQAFWR
jgi:hypothetical protein